MDENRREHSTGRQSEQQKEGGRPVGASLFMLADLTVTGPGFPLSGQGHQLHDAMDHTEDQNNKNHISHTHINNHSLNVQIDSSTSRAWA